TIEARSKNDIVKYRDIFLAIYLSDDKSTNDEIFRSLYKSIKGLIKNFIPTKNDGTDKSENVVSNSSNINFELVDWGIQNKKWFYWNSSDYEKFNEAKYREITSIYAIEKWDLLTCIKNAEVESFNKWFASLVQINREEFLQELNQINLINNPKINQLKLFRFSDSTFYSANETASKTDTSNPEDVPKTIVFHSTSTFSIKRELEILGFVSSDIDIEGAYPNLYKALGLKI